MRYAITAPTPLSEYSRTGQHNDFDFTVAGVRVAKRGDIPTDDEGEIDLSIGGIVVTVFIKVAAKRL